MRSSIKLLFLLTTLLLPTLLLSIHLCWVLSYDGPNNGFDEAHAITIDKDGYIYVAGESEGEGTSNDFCVLKYHPDGGDPIWEARYDHQDQGNSQVDIPCAIAVDKWGNVYVTGKTYFSEDQIDYLTVKFNSNGVVQWAKTYDTTGLNDLAAGIVLDADCYVYVTGKSKESDANSWDYLTIKYNPTTGARVWIKRYNGPRNGEDEATAIAVGQSDYIYVTGSSKQRQGSAFDYWTLKYDPDNGDQLDSARYNGSGDARDEANDIAVDKWGNVYVTGTSSISGSRSQDYATIKYNSDLDEKWVRTYNGRGGDEDEAHAITTDILGNVYVTGQSDIEDPLIATNWDYATIKYTSDGKLCWDTTYNGPANGWDMAYAIATDNLGNVYVTGKSEGIYQNEKTYDYATIKYDSTGDVKMVDRYNGAENGVDRANAIAVTISTPPNPADDSVFIYVTGGSDTENYWDYVTIKWAEIVGRSRGTQGSGFVIKPAYLDFNCRMTGSSFTIRLKNEALNEIVTLRIYNVLGHLVYSEKTNKGFFTVTELPSGIYILRIEAKGYTETGRVIVVK